MSQRDFIYCISKLMSYIQFHSGKFNVHTRDVRKLATKYNWSELTVRPFHVHIIGELSVNGLYDLSVNGMDVLSINALPRDIRGLRDLSITGLKILSVKVHPSYVRDSVDVTSDIGLPGMNFLDPKLALNGLNVLTGLGP